MPQPSFLDRLPLAAIFALSVVCVLGSIRGGFSAGLYRRRKGDEPQGAVGSVVGAMLGLLAFLLAFTFGIAASRFETRKHLLLDEVNAIGTAVLRADLLAEPQRGEVRALFRNYVDLRVSANRDGADVPKAIAESEAIQDQIWSQAAALSRTDLNSPLGALFVESLNAVFDLHTSRVTVAFQYRIPPSIWLALLVVTVFTMGAVGYQFGLAGHNSWLIHIALAITFSSVIWLIGDLDRANEGALRVSQQPMIELQQKLNAAK